MTRPLEGIRVLDWTIWQQGPVASLMLAANIHPKVVSERLGHSTVALTLDTYSHVVPGLQAAAAKRLDDVLAGEVADRVLFLENGEVRHEATPQDLERDPEPIHRYVGVRR